MKVTPLTTDNKSSNSSKEENSNGKLQVNMVSEEPIERNSSDSKSSSSSS